MLQLFRCSRHSFVVISLLSFLVLSSSCAGSSVNTVKPSPVLPMCGADISFLDQLESMNTGFIEDGKVTPLLDILKNNGVNWIRLRLWVDPSEHDNWCNLSRTVAIAKRVKAAGFSFLLDIHYSDWWADPSQQTIPAAWQSLPHADIASTIEDYSRTSVQEFVDAGASPDIVQVGNEITGGMLWPNGRT